MKKILTAFTAILLAVALCMTPLSPLFAAPADAAADYSTIRVRLSASTDDIDLGVNGSYLLKETGQTLTSNVNISISGTSIVVTAGSNVIFTGTEFNLIRQSGTLRQYNRSHGWRNYLGDMNYRIASDGLGGYKLVVTNTVGIEDYLIGVVGYEMSNTWPIEALKAQTVAARTYAISKISPSASYDIADTASDQVYKGYDSTITNVINAVKSTQGQVLVNSSGELVRAYYAASNGGQTQSTLNAWGTDLPYYVVKDDPYDIANPMSSTAKLTLPKVVSSATPLDAGLERYLKTLIAPKLAAMGYSGLTDSFSIVGTSAVTSYDREYPSPSRCFNRVEMTFLVSTNGSGSIPGVSAPQFMRLEGIADYVLYVNENRLVTLEEQAAILAQYNSAAGGGSAGASVSVTVDASYSDLATAGLFTNSSLRMYYSQETATSFELVNARFGHGVGMSQRGAQQMGNQGMSYTDIINFYYVGLSLAQLSTVSVTDDSSTGNSNNEVATPAVAEPSAVRGLLSAKTSLKAGPSSGSSSLVSISGGAEIDVVGQSGDWYLAISPSGKVGYLPTSAVALRYDDGIVAMATSSATLKDSPSTSGGDMVYVAKGDTMQIIASSGSYYLADVGSYVGFIPKSLVEIVVGAIEFEMDSDAYYGYTTSATPMLKSRTSTAVVATIPAGYAFEVKSQTSDKNFYNAVYNGQSGVVYQSQVTLLSKGSVHPNPRQLMEENSITLLSGTKKYVSGTEALNVRASASASAAILDTLTKNDQVVVLSTYSGWTKVQTACGLIGFVNSTYLSSSKGDTNAGSTGSTGSNGSTNVNTSASTNTGKVSTSGGALNMRASASSSANVVTTIPNGATVSLLAQNGDYYKVSYNGYTGYVLKTYVSRSSTPSSSTGTVSTSGGALNLREKATSASAVLTTVPNGSTVTLLAQNGDFYKVSYDGLTGYVLKSYIKRGTNSGGTETTPTPSPAPTPDSSDSSLTGVITTSGGSLNMRQKATSSSAVVTTIPNGATVSLLAQNGDYYKVSYNGYTGYVLKTYVNRGTGSTGGTGGTGSSVSENTTVVANGIISGNNINFRAAANTTSAVLGSLQNGTKVGIIAQTGDFYKVNYAGIIGYVQKAYVTNIVSVSGGTSTSSTKKGKITASELNVRSSASSSGTVIRKITKGTIVEIVATSGSFYQVKFSGGAGYVSKSYVEIIDSSKLGTVNAAVNFRTGPDPTYDKVEGMNTLAKGTIVEILSESDGWYKVNANGTTGYVSAKYVTR